MGFFEPMFPTTTTPVWMPMPMETGTRLAGSGAVRRRCALLRSTARAISMAAVTARSA